MYADRLRLEAGLPVERDDAPEPSEAARQFIRNREEAGAFREPTDDEMKEAMREQNAAERRVKRHPLRASSVRTCSQQILPLAKLEGRDDDVQDASDPRSDPNGSAKVALVAMDDSMNASLRVGERSAALDAIREVVELLEILG